VPSDLRPILRLEVPVIVVLGWKSMPVREVTALSPGSIIELPKKADEELELLINNKAIGTGTAVKVGENFGVRITYIGDLRQRVTAMGPSAEAPNAPPAPPTGGEAGPTPEAPEPVSIQAGEPAPAERSTRGGAAA
jgi:flagellar motor switch protein FliN/FliY